MDVSRDDQWPPSTSPGVRRYLTALTQYGPSHFMSNAVGVKAETLRVGDFVLPLLVSDAAPGKASILSPLAHHVAYPVEEISRRSRLSGRRTMSAAVSPLSLVLKAGALDRVVFINHWLLSGAPTPEVPRLAWPTVVSFLADRYPSHTLLVQDVKPSLQGNLNSALAAAGGLAIRTRRVHIVDPRIALAGPRFRKVRYNRNVAKRLVRDAEKGLALARGSTWSERTACSALRTSNIDRHSALNPVYLPSFFDLALACEEFRLDAWRAPDASSDQIVAFNLQRLDLRMIHWSTFGCEPSEPGTTGRGTSSYYQRIAATDLAVAEGTGRLLDSGAGADEYKRLRGAITHPQFEIAFFNHLGPRRRAAWHLLARLRAWRARQVDSPAARA